MFHKFSLVTVVGLACSLILTACNKSDSDSKKSEETVLSFEGIWAPHAPISGENKKTHQTKSETEYAQDSYAFYVIDSEMNLTFQGQGYIDGESNKKVFNEVKVKAGKLERTDSSTAKRIVTEEDIEAAKKAGFSEQVIRDELNNPCTYKLKTKAILEVNCQPSPSGREFRNMTYVKIDADKAEKKKITVQKALATITAAKENQLKKMAGKKISLIEIKIVATSDKGDQTFVEKAEDLKEEFTLESGEVRIRPKLLVLGSELTTAKVNEKHDVQVDIQASKDMKDIYLNILMKEKDGVYANLASGLFKQTETGFSLTDTYTSEGTNYTRQTVFKISE